MRSPHAADPSTVLLGALIAAAPLAMDIYLASMPSMTAALHASPQAVQLTLTVYMYCWGAAQLFAGPLSDRHGRRPALLAGLAVFVLASAACALAPTIGALVVARGVQALAIAAIAIVPRAVVRDLYSGDRAAHVLSLMAVVLGIAPIVAPLVGSHVHVWLGWRANFVLVSVYGAVLLVWVYRRLPETLRARDTTATRPRTLLTNYGRLLRSRRFVGYMLVAAFTQAGLFAFLAGSAFVFVTVMGQGERGFGVLFGSVMLGSLAGATVGSRLVRRWGIDALIRRASVLLVVAGIAVAALAWAGVEHPLAVVVPMFFYMAALMATMPPATAGALTPFPQIAGAASSLLSFVAVRDRVDRRAGRGSCVRRHVAGDGHCHRAGCRRRVRRLSGADRPPRAGLASGCRGQRHGELGRGNVGGVDVAVVGEARRRRIFPQHPQHRRVVGDDQRAQSRDAADDRRGREAGQHHPAEPHALEVVDDRQRDLGDARVARGPHEAAGRDAFDRAAGVAPAQSERIVPHAVHGGQRVELALGEPDARGEEAPPARLQ